MILILLTLILLCCFKTMRVLIGLVVIAGILFWIFHT
jgi:hypothetical protein